MKGVVLLGGALTAAVVVALTADRTSTSPAPPAAERAQAAAPAPPEEAGTSIRGAVREAFDVAEYTYLRLEAEGGNEVWAAVSKSAVNVGARVTIEDAALMTDFRSESLKRTFPAIYFGNLRGSAGSAEPTRLPPGHPSIEDARGAPSPHTVATSPHATAGATPEDVEVPRASGPGSKTIAELFEEGASLRGKLVRVRGRIVKATAVQGVTYYRLRDGSSADPARIELVISSTSQRAVGEVATFEGTASTDVDIGIGRKYPVMLQNARDVS